MNRIIVSMTSYPARIRYVPVALRTIFKQTKPADFIVLWLAEEQFPGKIDELPRGVIDLIESGKITLRWCNDLKPHKKYYYAFLEYPDDLIITIDDDLLFPVDMIEKLYSCYLRHPNAVCCMRAHLMVYDEICGVLPYDAWIKEYDRYIDIPSMQLLCTGGAGALYPVHLFDQSLLNKKAITKHCLYADDIWLKLMEVACGIPVVLADHHRLLEYISDSQQVALFNDNIKRNDIQFKDSTEWFDGVRGDGFIMEKLLNIPKEQRLLTMEDIYRNNQRILNDLRHQITDMENSVSFRVGRALTWPMRTLRDKLHL